MGPCGVVVKDIIFALLAKVCDAQFHHMSGWALMKAQTTGLES